MSDQKEQVRPVVKRSLSNSILRVLGSLVFALSVVLLLAVACLLGTVIPQGEQVQAYLSRPGGHPVLTVLMALGFTRIFYSWWFVALLFALAATLMVCSRRRFQTMMHVSGAARLRVSGSFITHISLLLILAGGVIRVIWGQKGMIQFREGQVIHQAEGGDGVIELPYALRLTKFDLEFHKVAGVQPADKLFVRWEDRDIQLEFPLDLNVDHPVVAKTAVTGGPSSYVVTLLRVVPDFSMDGSSGEVVSRSDYPNNPAVQIRVVGGGTTNTQWVFARFPDFGGHDSVAGGMPLEFRYMAVPPSGMGGAQGPIKAFKSTVDVLENGVVTATRTIEVNVPFTWKGFTFYQTSYNPDDLAWSALQVVRDPGIPLVYAGFILMMVGLSLVFCVGAWMNDQRSVAGGVS